MSPKRATGSLNQNRHRKSHSLITVYTIRKRQMGIHKIQFVFLVSNSVTQRKASEIRMRSTVCTLYFYRFYQDYNTESQSVFLPSTPCYFSPLADIPGSIELLESSLTYEGVQWRKIIVSRLPRSSFFQYIYMWKQVMFY